MRARVGAVTVAWAIAAGTMAFLPPAAALADPISQNAIGTYTLGWKPDQPAAKWVLTPCDNDAPRCVTVSQYGLADTTMKKAVISGRAQWAVGSWVMVTDVPNIVKCQDGTGTTLPVTFAWDAATGEGNRSFTDPGLCGKEPAIRSIPFFLTKVDSAMPPAPVARPAAAPNPPLSATAPVLPPPGAAEAPALPSPTA